MDLPTSLTIGWCIERRNSTLNTPMEINVEDNRVFDLCAILIVLIVLGALVFGKST